MFGARASVALALACALLPAVPRPVAADAPVPLDYKAYDGWNRILTPKLSDDGRRLAYALTPQDGDPTLVVRDLDGGAERRETRGSTPAFAGGSRFVVFTHVAPKKDVDAAKKAKKPAAEQPKNGVGILDLDAAEARRDRRQREELRGRQERRRDDRVPRRTVARAERFARAVELGVAGRVRAAQRAAARRAEPARGRAGHARARRAERGARAVAVAVRVARAQSRQDERARRVAHDSRSRRRQARHGDRRHRFAVSDDDRFVAYATETKNGKNDGLHVYDVAQAKTIDVLTGEGRYRNLAISRDGATLAFLSDVATFKEDVPHDAGYVVDLRAPKLTAVKAIDAGGTGLPPNTTPNSNAKLSFSRDGKHLLLGTAAAPTPMPSGTPAPTAVDLWTSHDDTLQSQQKHDADTERKRTYLAAYDVATGRFAQLGSPALRDVVVAWNGAVALGQDDRAYRRASSWMGETFADAYAVSLADGRRTLLARKASSADLSPDGRFVLLWDQATKHWATVRVADRKRVELAPHAGVAFHQTDDDHPAPPPPYGNGGWLAGDRGVLLYDEYDVWLANPDTGAATNLTRGEGRKTRTVYSPVDTDRDAMSFPADKPLLLSLIDTRDYSSGYARVAPSGGVPRCCSKRPRWCTARATCSTAACTTSRWPRSPRSTPTATCSRASPSATFATSGRRTRRSSTWRRSRMRTRSSRNTAGAQNG